MIGAEQLAVSKKLTFTPSPSNNSCKKQKGKGVDCSGKSQSSLPKPSTQPGEGGDGADHKSKKPIRRYKFTSLGANLLKPINFKFVNFVYYM